MTNAPRLVLLTLISLAIPGLRASGQAAGEAPLRFNRDIRPILSNNCFKCHGPDEKKRKGGLRLDSFEGATAARKKRAAVVPGKPADSELVARIHTGDEDDQMPPPDSGKSLTPAQKQILTKWVEQGATYQKHWSFEPIARVAPPAVKQVGWVRNPIDAFVLARLEAAGLMPSAEADRYTLIRRVYLDLIGLPPTTQEAEAFVNDHSSDAYEKVVERLLANPHHGERWARHWLDQARYADSNGYSIDSPRTMWPYRDWVIKAINDDMPFDRFTIEQLAGDLLEKPTESQLVATGFHRNTLINQEGGTDPEQFRVEAAVDRLNTTASVWLGLTVGCAQCHTHKFDPISHTEYYQLYAFFNSDADRNTADPVLRMPTPEQKEKLAALKKQLADARRELAAYDKRPAAGTQIATEASKRAGEWKATKWTVVPPSNVKAQSSAQLTKLEDGSVLANGKNPDEELYQITINPPLQKVTAIRLEALTDDTLPHKGPGRAKNGNFVLHEFRVIDSGGGARAFADALADFEQNDYPVDSAVDGRLDTGWAINTGAGGGPMNVARSAVFVFKQPAEFKNAEPLLVELQSAPGPRGYAIGRLRLSVTDQEKPNLGEGDPLGIALRTEPAKLTPAQKQLLADRLRIGEPGREALAKRMKDAEDAIRKVEGEAPNTMVMRRLPEPRPTFVHVRGDFLRHGDPVQPGTLAVLHPFKHETEVATRLDLAKWLVDPANPLTPRVTVNRVWMRYFGNGLVETENDFGTQGTPPTHSELLDWLGGQLVHPSTSSGQAPSTSSGQPWSMKELHRLIVTSATYRQASTARADLAKVDPTNKLLGRQNRLRVEAEIVRDLALGASGMLIPKIGGPSVYPPQPEGVYAFTQVKQKWPTSTGEDRYRRGLYTFVFRSSPYPALTTFDVPRPDVACTRRIRSNTPLQALTWANSTVSFEIAQGLAKRLLTTEPGADDAARLSVAFRTCLARAPQPQESTQLLAFLRDQQAGFAADLDNAKKVAPKGLPAGVEPARAAAWTALARVLINLDEFVTRE
jgi:hypothetical protein